MTTSDWPAFLTARLDELHYRVLGATNVGHWTSQFSRYTMVDIAAKRAILERYRKYIEYSHEHPEDRQHWDRALAAIADIQDLCRPFADHDDYPRESNSGLAG